MLPINSEVSDMEVFWVEAGWEKFRNCGPVVGTVEEVSDDDLPEVIEERRFGNREEIASDADSNFSMVSNNSLTAENCHTSDKDKKSKSDVTSKPPQDTTERDEISSLSGLSSEDEMKENDRLQDQEVEEGEIVTPNESFLHKSILRASSKRKNLNITRRVILMTGPDEIRDLEDGEITRERRLRDRSNKVLASNGQNLTSPSRNSLYGGSGSAGGRDSALSGRNSQHSLYSSKRRNKRRLSKYDDNLERDSEEENLKLPHMMERHVIERDESPNGQEEFDRRMGSSPNMYSFGRKDAGKRIDLPRYDVRNVIERKKKEDKK
jgi:hypothetical protein